MDMQTSLLANLLLPSATSQVPPTADMTDFPAQFAAAIAADTAAPAEDVPMVPTVPAVDAEADIDSGGADEEPVVALVLAPMLAPMPEKPVVPAVHMHAEPPAMAAVKVAVPPNAPEPGEPEVREAPAAETFVPARNNPGAERAVEKAQSPAAAPRALAQGESPETDAGDSGAGGTNGSGGQKFSAAAADAAPFRLESGTPAAAAPDAAPGALARAMPGAALAAAPAAPAPLATHLPVESASAATTPMADITVGLDGAERLEVTLATASADAARRLHAEAGRLQAELSALGAEVEAIRVELRGDRGSEGGAKGESSQSQQTGHSGAQQSETGQDARDGQRGRWETRFGLVASNTAAAGPPAAREAAGMGKVDRYA